MKSSQIIGRKWLAATVMALGMATTQAQTIDTYVGPASGGEWNTAVNWSTLAPPLDATTNAIIFATTNVNYNLPMATAGFGTLSLYGTLNINTNGFNTTGISMVVPPGGERLFINTGAVVTVSGSLTMGSNTVTTLSAGASLTVGSLVIDAGASSKAASTSTFTNNGGTLNANSTTINNNTGTSTGLLVVNGGTNNLGNTAVGRNNSGAGGTTLGTEGLVIYNGIVTMTNLNIGNNGNGASSLSAYVAGGLVTNIGSVFINQGTSGRFSRFVQNGGTFVVPDPGVVNPNPTVSGSLNYYTVAGGTNIVGGFFLGSSNATAGTVIVTNAGTMYIGSQGIANNGVVTVTMVLNSGGMFGATAPWTGSQAMKLAGGVCTVQTADMNNNPNNITLTGALSGNGGLTVSGHGILTLGAANTYSGNTTISAGSLVLNASGSLTSPNIKLASGTIFDVSQVSGFALAGTQTLSGSGTVNGAVSAATGATIYPGSNSVTGTLTFSTGMTESGGVVNEFNLSSNPLGPNNDLVVVNGGLNLSGVNTIIINGALTSGSAYPLFNYSGGLSGGVANLSVSGATGILSNSTANSTIYFIAQTSIRAATNVLWVGNSLNNIWDIETTTNWENAGTGSLDFFVPGDTAIFANVGDTNSQVNISGVVVPSSVLVNSVSNYVFTGVGSIAGLGGITVSNGSVLTVLVTNNYSGQTILTAGGVLATPLIANSGNPSGLGGGTTDPGNIIFNNGVLNYYGATVGTDHGMTLTNGGGTFDVTNGTTLTLNGTLIGNGGLTKVDNGNLELASANNYTNTTIMNGGTLTVDNVFSLGSGAVQLNAGSLTLGAVKPANTIIPGGGWITGGNAGGLTGIKDVIGSGNLGIAVTVSTGVFDLTGTMTNYSGTITFTNAGGGTVRINDGSTTIPAGSALASWNLGAGPMDLNIRSSNTNVLIGALEGAAGTTLSGRGGSSNNGPTTQIIGGNNLSTTFGGVIQNGTGGSASIVAIAKVGSGTLSLSGANTYTGTTTISNGVLALVNNGAGADGSISGSSGIYISAGAVLDVSGRSDDTMPLVSGQLLDGTGTVNGILDTTGGGLVSPGGGTVGAPGTLTVVNTINLGGTTWMKLNRGSSPNSDRLVSSTASVINYGGTLVVTNVGAALQPGDTFTLFNAATLNGSFTVVLPSYTSWDTTKLNVNGSIKLLANLPPPAIGSVDFSGISGGNINISITNGISGGGYSVLTSTNLTLPLSKWTVNVSGGFDGNGNANTSVTVDPTLPQLFIIVQGQ